MATYEHTVLHQHKDQNGDMHIDYPITKAENVDGLDTFVQTEVADLKKSVSDGKTSVANAITAKGVSTATDATFATMATNISNIPTGVDTSDATAVAGDIISGKTAYVNGSKVTGSMANQGSKTASLNCGGSYTIPAGYHNGGGVITANNLASQTGATATAAQILSGYTAWANGAFLTGTASAGLKFASGEWVAPATSSSPTRGDYTLLPMTITLPVSFDVQYLIMVPVKLNHKMYISCGSDIATLLKPTFTWGMNTDRNGISYSQAKAGATGTGTFDMTIALTKSSYSTFSLLIYSTYWSSSYNKYMETSSNVKSESYIHYNWFAFG